MKGLLLLLGLSLGLCARAEAQSCHLSLAPVHFGTVNMAALTSSAIAVATISCTPQEGTMYACLAFAQEGKVLVNTTHDTSSLPFEFTSDGVALGTGDEAPMLGPFQPTPQGIPISFGVILKGISSTLYSGLYQNSAANFTVLLYDQPVAEGPDKAPPTCAQIKAAGMPPVRAPLLVSADVPPVCTVSATPMVFGSVNVLTRPVAAQSSIQVQCNTANELIALDNGGTGTGPKTRFMVSGANRVSYGIYQDTGHIVPWGSTKGTDTETASGTTTLIAYGLVPVQTTPPPGLYTDVVTVTVSY